MESVERLKEKIRQLEKRDKRLEEQKAASEGRIKELERLMREEEADDRKDRGPTRWEEGKRVWEGWKQVRYRDLDGKQGEGIEIKLENPMIGDEKVKVVWVTKEDGGMEKGIQRLFTDRYPMLGEKGEKLEWVKEVRTTERKGVRVNAEQLICRMEGDCRDERKVFELMSRLFGEVGSADIVWLHRLEHVGIEVLMKMVA